MNIVQSSPTKPDTHLANHPSWFVVEDPQGVHDEGCWIDAGAAHRLHAAGGCAIPAVPAFCGRGGSAGIHVRRYGHGVLVGDRGRPGVVASASMFLTTATRAVAWRAGIQTHEPSAPHNGTLSLQPFPVGSPLNLSGRSSVQFREFGTPDVGGGWIVGGSCSAMVVTEGFYGVALNGLCTPDARLVWLAVAALDRV